MGFSPVKINQKHKDRKSCYRPCYMEYVFYYLPFFPFSHPLPPSLQSSHVSIRKTSVYLILNKKNTFLKPTFIVFIRFLINHSSYEIKFHFCSCYTKSLKQTSFHTSIRFNKQKHQIITKCLLNITYFLGIRSLSSFQLLDSNKRKSLKRIDKNLP